MMNYTVFYKNDTFPRGTRFGYWEVPATVDKNGYKEITDLQAQTLEEVFDRMNVVHGDELPLQLKVRSLSVGDVVRDNRTGEMFYCAPIGWQKVSWS